MILFFKNKEVDLRLTTKGYQSNSDLISLYLLYLRKIFKLSHNLKKTRCLCNESSHSNKKFYDSYNLNVSANKRSLATK